MAAPHALSAAQRAEAMGERLLDTMRSGLIAPGAAELVHTAYLLATKPRAATLSAKDTRLLHPGQTVLILWQDCNTRDPGELAAAALLESQDFELRAQLDEFPSTAITELVEAIPNPRTSGYRLLEDLLALDRQARALLLQSNWTTCAICTSATARSGTPVSSSRRRCTSPSPSGPTPRSHAALDAGVICSRSIGFDADPSCDTPTPL